MDLDLMNVQLQVAADAIALCQAEVPPLGQKCEEDVNAELLRSELDDAASSIAVCQQELAESGTAPVPPGTDITVKPGDDLQAAFDTLRDTGGTIRAQPGEYLVNLVLKPRPDNSKIIVFTTDTANLPGEGIRIDPSYQSGLAILRSADGYAGAFEAQRGSGGVSFVGCGFGPQVYDRTVVALGDDTTELASELPTDFLFDRVFFYGDPEKGQHRAIMAHCNRLSVLNCYVQDFHEEGRDSQCVAAWNGGRHIDLDNTYFEGGAENVMFGGSDARSVEMIPQDIRITRCLFSKPLRWKSLAHQPSIKCLLEIKNVIRLHIEGCVFDGNWSRDWPSGVGVVFKVSPNGSRYTECQDVTFVNNVIRNCGAVFSIVGSRDGGEPSGRMTNVTLHNNLAYNICDSDDYTGDGRHVPIANPPIGLHITHNTVSHGWCHSFMNWWWDEVEETGEDLVMTDNCAHHGEYGIHSSDGAGIDALDVGWPGEYRVTGNALKKHPDRTVKLPEGNVVIPEADYDASFGADHKVIPGSAVAQVATTDGAPIGADLDAIAVALAPTESL